VSQNAPNRLLPISYISYSNSCFQRAVFLPHSGKIFCVFENDGLCLNKNTKKCPRTPKKDCFLIPISLIVTLVFNEQSLMVVLGHFFRFFNYRQIWIVFKSFYTSNPKITFVFLLCRVIVFYFNGVVPP
jgi:hypothetical protein